ncbi:MAG: DUF3488 and DUF4129 domain-containing transglutaminase family protein [Aestuariibacter sp.]
MAEIKYNNRAHLALALCYLMLSLSLVKPLMIWIMVLVFISVSMRIAYFWNWHYHLPSVRTINLFAILCAVILAYTGLQIGLLLSMVNMLVMASALKLMQMRTARDYFLLVCAQFFIIGCGLIFEQSIAYSLFYAATTLFLLLSLAYKIAPTKPIISQVRLVSKLSLQALPICLLLFLVLPKIEPLWKMPRGKGAETGLSEIITPGSIANLSQSDELAFRAEFEGDIPPAKERYWRALVFEEFDGTSWQVAEIRKKVKRNLVRARDWFRPEYAGDPVYQYDVIVEPTEQVWLFSLDVPLSLTDGVWLSHDFQLQHRHPVVSKLKYSVHSYPQTPRITPLTYLDTNINLMLPDSGNPETVEWVSDMRRRFPDRARFINEVERFFVKENYSYTLRPAPMLYNPIDKLLFEQKSGFCAHYASAYAYIMRLAGIPARVVGGYQGGEMRGERYLSVYQYDAHAWVEIWDPTQGWVKKDPTGLIAPERIEFGLEFAVAYEDSFLENSPFALARLKDFALFNQVRLLLADMDFLWSSMILGFDKEMQLAMFSELVGDLKRSKIAMLLFAAFILVGVLLLIFNYRLWFPQITNLPLHYYKKLLFKLDKKGFKRQPEEGPLQFAGRIGKQLPKQQSHALTMLTECFVALQYNNTAPPTKQQLAQFRQQIKSFLKQL